jgi:CHASE2 domain-containing sensor protein
MERRVQRLKLSLTRVGLGFLFGLVAGLSNQPLSILIFVAYILIAIIAIGYYAKMRMEKLHDLEPYYVGVISSLASFTIGLIMASAI